MNRTRYKTDAAVGATVALTATVMPAGGSGANAGCWANAADRNTAIANFAALRTDLIAIKTEVAGMRGKLGV